MKNKSHRSNTMKKKKNLLPFRDMLVEARINAMMYESYDQREQESWDDRKRIQKGEKANRSRWEQMVMIHPEDTEDSLRARKLYPKKLNLILSHKYILHKGDTSAFIEKLKDVKDEELKDKILKNLIVSDEVETWKDSVQTKFIAKYPFLSGILVAYKEYGRNNPKLRQICR